MRCCDLKTEFILPPCSYMHEMHALGSPFGTRSQIIAANCFCCHGCYQLDHSSSLRNARRYSVI